MPMTAHLRIAAGALLVAAASPAFAQEAPEPAAVISPLKAEPDVNGVNLLDGKKIVEMPVVLSVPAAPRLTFDRIQNAAPYVDGTINTDGSGSSWSAHYGGDASESFKCDAELICSSVTSSGSMFRLPGHNYQQAGTGVVYGFGLRHSRATGTTTTRELRYALGASYPDGETISYTYQSGFLPGDPLPSCVNAPLNANCRTFYRPTRIDSSTGYYITISYQYTGTDVSNPGWGVAAEAAIYSPSNVLIRRLAYGSGSITDYGNSATNTGGRTFTTSGVGNALGVQLETANATMQLPGEGSPQLTIIGSSSHGTNNVDALIDSITRDGVLWIYSYVNARRAQVGPGQTVLRYDSVTVAGPNGYNVAYAMFGPGATVGINQRNLIQSRTDALNRTTSFDYGLGDRLSEITMPEGDSVSLDYDDCGNISSKTTTPKSGSGLSPITETAVYPVAGQPENLCPGVLNYRPTSYTDARGSTTNYTYNSAGQLTQELAPADASNVRRQTNISYANSASGISRRTLVRVCGGTSCALDAESRTSYTYFGNTNLPLTVTQTDEDTNATRVTTYAYDAAGRVTMIDGPLAGTGDARYFQYDKFGRKAWEVGELAPNNLRLAKTFTYRDSDDKVTKIETGTVACTANCDTASLTLTLLQATDTTYDSRRYPIREKTYKGAATHAVTDRSFLDRGLNDCTTVRMNLGALPAATATGACALGTQGSQGPDRITRNSYDAAGQLTKVQKAYLTADQADTVTYTYTANGKQSFVTDANGNRAQFAYDGFDRLLKWSFPSKTTPGTVSATDFEQYGYDANGNRTSLRKRDASTLNFTYDALNRMTLKVVPSRADLTPAQTRDVYFGYDILGRQLFARFDSGAASADGVTNSYNGFGDLLTSQLRMGTFNKILTSLYDSAGRRTRLTHPDNQAFTYAYDNLSRLSGVYQGTGTGTPLATFSYANNGLVSNRSEGSTGASSASYGWDDINRLVSQADAFSGGTNNVAWTFGYNPASQIVTETRDNDSYAPALTAASTAYAVNGLNQYTSVGGSAHLYDANGNLTSGGGTTYTYDIENRLVKAVAGGTTTNLIYDPLGRLYQTDQGTSGTTTKFLTDGDAMVLEFSNTNAVTNRTIHGSNAAADDPLVWYLGSTLTIKRWLHADHLGSITAWTNSSGGSPTLNTYDEYGVPAAANTGRFQYTGQAWIGELGLYHYKARFYSPALGRFLQTDPVGYDDQVNLYTYVGNDPINSIDARGETGECTGSLISTACPPQGGLASGRSGFTTALGLTVTMTPAQGRQVAMKLGELVRGSAVRATIRRHESTINLVSKTLRVDAALIRAIIFEEQAHLDPIEAFRERLGIGNTVGLGQVTVGSFGFDREQLLNPVLNIVAVGMHIRSIMDKPLINPDRPAASIATRYNCGSCNMISAYGERVEDFAGKFR